MAVRIEVIHDADGLVVVNKPPGIETTGRTTDDPRGLQHHLERHLGRPVFAAHQLDRDTSGVLVFVRKKSLVAATQARMRADAGAKKRYLAFVRGRVPWAKRTIDAPLAYDAGARRWVVREGGKDARTIVTRQRVGADLSLVEARLLTGRTHQARVHLAHVGHPVLGERRYVDPPCDRHPRQALHAWRLELTGLILEAPLPDDLASLRDRVLDT